MAKVYHSEIYGLRENKYDWLNKHNIKNVKWNKLDPTSEFYLFIPQDKSNEKEYFTYKKITEIFNINSTGVKTHRDNFIIAFNMEELIKRLQLLKLKQGDDDILRRQLNLSDNRDWSFKEARKKFIEDKNWKEKIITIQYRPFDFRKIFYVDYMIDRPRFEVMKSMLEENIALCCNRQYSGNDQYSHFLASNVIVDNRTFFSAKGTIQIAPLFVYPDSDKKDLFSEHETGEKKPNIKPELFDELKNDYKKDVKPEEIFYYIYAVVYSNAYRTKYSEFLKIDFPRVPFTKDYKLFTQLGKIGNQLADLHLLKPASPAGGSKELDKTISKFPIRGSNKVEKPRFDLPAGKQGSAQRGRGKVWINKEQYFDGVKEEVWQYQIGGYQVCEKWLKDRKERTLTLDEIKTYCKIVTSLSKTIELQNEIDKYFKEVEKTV